MRKGYRIVRSVGSAAAACGAIASDSSANMCPNVVERGSW